MARGSGDASDFFRPRTVSKSVTTSWETLNIPPRAHKVEFRARGGDVAVRVNNSGPNFLNIGPNDMPFNVTLDDGMVIEVRGQNGSETLVCYIS
jgi:hypothetical protein